MTSLVRHEGADVRRFHTTRLSASCSFLLLSFRFRVSESPKQPFVTRFLLHFRLGNGFRLQLSGILPSRVLAGRRAGIHESRLDLQECRLAQVREILAHLRLHLGAVQNVLDLGLRVRQRLQARPWCDRPLSKSRNLSECGWAGVTAPFGKFQTASSNCLARSPFLYPAQLAAFLGRGGV